MSTKTKVHCDQCGRYLNIDSSYPHNYGICLTPKDYGVNTTSITYVLAQYPPMDSVKDFCTPTCVREWVEANFNPDA